MKNSAIKNSRMEVGFTNVISPFAHLHYDTPINYLITSFSGGLLSGGEVLLPALCFITLLFSRAHNLSPVMAFLSLFCCGELFLQCKAAGNTRAHTVHEETHPTASHKSSRVSMAFFNLLARKVSWYQWSQRHRSHQGTRFAHYKESCCAITSVLGHFQSYSPNELCLPMVYTEVAPTNSEIHILGWKLIF